MPRNEVHTGQIFTAVLLSVAFAAALPAQKINVAHTFCLTGFPCLDGFGVPGPLVEGIDGNLYGTSQGGANTFEYGNGNGLWGGTMFRVTSIDSGTPKLETIYNFCNLSGCADGGGPIGMLVRSVQGEAFYGTTSFGGANPGQYGYGLGTIFKITASGVLTTLYNFCSLSNCADGYTPWGGLVQTANGDLYGLTYLGGLYGKGTVFKITPNGEFTSLYSFCSKMSDGGCLDGAYPNQLTIGSDGNVYGTTGSDGLWRTVLGGTVFRVTPSGTLTTIYSFCKDLVGSHCTDGSNPQVLIQGIDGNLYGTTAVGGPNPAGTPAWDPGFWAFGAGTIFRLTSKGELTTMYNFCNHVSQGLCTDGQFPSALIQASDGNLYGATEYGGGGFEQSTEGNPGPLSAEGTIFKLTLSGAFMTLHDFCSDPGDGLASGCKDGYEPVWLYQATNGRLYGGASSWIPDAAALYSGELFDFSAVLPQFVETLPSSGTVGTKVRIIGDDFAGATGVSFGGTAATNFTIVSKHLIETTVPVGATTGLVSVVTPAGALESNAPFTVKP